MTYPNPSRNWAYDDDWKSVLALGSVVLTLCGAAVRLAVQWPSKRFYVSTATVVPLSSDGSAGIGLVLAPNQFEIRVRTRRRAALVYLLQVTAPTPGLRIHVADREVGDIVEVCEDQTLGAVKPTVSTQWPAVSPEAGNAAGACGEPIRPCGVS